MSNGLQDMNFFLVIFGLVTDRQTDRQMESNVYEPTVHRQRWAQKCRFWVLLRDLIRLKSFIGRYKMDFYVECNLALGIKNAT